MLIMAFSHGVIMSYIPNLDQALTHLKYKNPSSTTAMITVSASISGMLGSMFFMKRIKQTLQYKKILIIGLFLSFFMFSITQVSLLNMTNTW